MYIHSLQGFQRILYLVPVCQVWAVNADLISTTGCPRASEITLQDERHTFSGCCSKEVAPEVVIPERRSQRKSSDKIIPEEIVQEIILLGMG